VVLGVVVLLAAAAGVAVVVRSSLPAARGTAAHASASPAPAASPSPSRSPMTVAGPLPSGAPVCGAKLAFVGSLTGRVGPLGTSIHQGAQLAVDEYNKAHAGCTVTLADFDMQSDSGRAATVATAAAADQQVIGVIGPVLTSEVNGALPVLDRAGLTAITPTATTSGLSANGWRVFHRAVPNDVAQGTAAARYISQELHATKVFVVDDGSPYGSLLAGTVRAGLGGAVAGTDRVRGGQTTFPTTVARIKGSGATAVFYGGYSDEAGALLTQLRAAGSTATLVGGDGILDPTFVTAAGQNAEGAATTCSCVPPTDLRFDSAYRAAFSTGPGYYSGTGYDVANIFLVGLAHGVGTRADMLAFVNSFDGTGICGGYRFTGTGELDPARVSVAVFVVRGGQFTYDRSEPGQ
jgi:branched-chain amino acid transport system substrate-binding protein